MNDRLYVWQARSSIRNLIGWALVRMPIALVCLFVFPVTLIVLLVVAVMHEARLHGIRTALFGYSKVDFETLVLS